MMGSDLSRWRETKKLHHEVRTQLIRLSRYTMQETVSNGTFEYLLRWLSVRSLSHLSYYTYPSNTAANLA